MPKFSIQRVSLDNILSDNLRIFKVSLGLKSLWNSDALSTIKNLSLISSRANTVNYVDATDLKGTVNRFKN